MTPPIKGKARENSLSLHPFSLYLMKKYPALPFFLPLFFFYILLTLANKYFGTFRFVSLLVCL